LTPISPLLQLPIHLPQYYDLDTINFDVAGGDEGGATSPRSVHYDIPDSLPFNISALRSRLNRLRNQRTTLSSTDLQYDLSTADAPSIESAPVLVTAYSGPRLRLSSVGMGRRSTKDALPALPPISSFSFAHILTTIETDIKDPLDAISVICARSAYSLADEYNAHLPPQGEIRAGSLLPIRGRHGLWIRTAGLEGSGAALSVVPEGSSSSGASETGTMRSAYGSLRDVLMNKGKTVINDNGSMMGKYSIRSTPGSSTTWAVVTKDGKKGSIVILHAPQASRQLSTTSVIERTSDGGEMEPIWASSLPPTPSAGMPSWLLPFRRPQSPASDTADRQTAESALRNLFRPPSSGPSSGQSASH
jgi:hypothetical protein